MNFTRLLHHLTTPRWRARLLFPRVTLARIERAVRESETRHQGQIRFTIEHALDAAALLRGQSARERAVEVFSALRVWDTEHNNGVLVYLLFADRDVEIVADRGVQAKAGAEGWEQTCRDMEAAFRAGRFEQGVLRGIERVSAILETHYPRGEPGPNELPDRPVML